MTVEYISVEKYKKLLASVNSSGYSVEESVILHQGFLFKLLDLYQGGWVQLVPDTGLMRVLI